MPVYVKQWLDGDFTLVFAKDLDDATRIFEQTACTDPATILQLNSGDLSVEFTLAPNGQLICTNFTPAVKEARDACYADLIRTLAGHSPDHITDPEHQKRVAKVVEDELKIRKESKLSARLLSRNKRRRRK